MLVMNSPLTQAYGGVDNKAGGNGRRRTHAQGQFSYVAVDNSSKRDYVHEIANCPIICTATNPFVLSHTDTQFCATQISRYYLRQKTMEQMPETACVWKDLRSLSRSETEEQKNFVPDIKFLFNFHPRPLRTMSVVAVCVLWITSQLGSRCMHRSNEVFTRNILFTANFK
jgi:hypothetical protein